MQGTLEFVLQSARAVMASLAMSYEVETGVSVDQKELKCMAENIYFEGRAEPMVGKIAIGHVVMNRIEDERFPDTICGCQFSWWCDGQKDIVWATYMNGEIIESNMTAWRDSIHVALFIMSGDYTMDPTGGAVFYYNPHIANPSWGLLYQETAMIGNHRFMKDK